MWLWDFLGIIPNLVPLSDISPNQVFGSVVRELKNITSISYFDKLAISLLLNSTLLLFSIICFDLCFIVYFQCMLGSKSSRLVEYSVNVERLIETRLRTIMLSESGSLRTLFDYPKPTLINGYWSNIVRPLVIASNFELKLPFIQMVQ